MTSSICYVAKHILIPFITSKQHQLYDKNRIQGYQLNATLSTLLVKLVNYLGLHLFLYKVCCTFNSTYKSICHITVHAVFCQYKKIGWYADSKRSVLFQKKEIIIALTFYSIIINLTFSTEIRAYICQMFIYVWVGIRFAHDGTMYDGIMLV